MGGENLREARPKQAPLIAAGGVAVVLLVVALIYWYDLVHLDAHTLADRVHA